MIRCLNQKVWHRGLKCQVTIMGVSHKFPKSQETMYIIDTPQGVGYTTKEQMEVIQCQ